MICSDDYVAGWPGVVQAVDEAFPSINRVGGQQWWVKKAQPEAKRIRERLSACFGLRSA